MYVFIVLRKEKHVMPIKFLKLLVSVQLFQTTATICIIFENISRFIPGDIGGAPAVIFMLVERDSVDGSLGNGVDCA